jgi:hypothetical protein
MDPASQEKQGVNYLQYRTRRWTRPLPVDAPNAEAAQQVHREAHGPVATRSSRCAKATKPSSA